MIPGVRGRNKSDSLLPALGDDGGSEGQAQLAHVTANHVTVVGKEASSLGSNCRGMDDRKTSPGGCADVALGTTPPAA